MAVRAPTWRDLEPAIKTHDAWGVRVIFSARRGVKPDPRVRYMEGWKSAAPTEAGRETTTIDRDERAIVALGITYPPGAAPQDVRVWRVDADDELEPIDARPLDGRRADGALLFLRFDAEDAGFRTWDAGRYRIGMLNDDGVRWIDVEIPVRPGGEAPPDMRPAPEALVVGERASDPRAVRVGLFASVNREGPRVEARASSVYDASTWFKTSRRPSVAPPRITSAYLSRPTWLGVMLPQRASVRWATIRPLAPDAGFDPVSGGVSRIPRADAIRGLRFTERRCLAGGRLRHLCRVGGPHRTWHRHMARRAWALPDPTGVHDPTMTNGWGTGEKPSA